MDLMLSIVLGATMNLQAQKTTNKNFIVKGVLVDSLTHEGEPYATIRIFTPNDTKKAVYAAVTQPNGKSHRFGLSVNSFSAKFSTNINLSYRVVNNSIQGYTFMQDGIQHSTYANIGRAQTTDLFIWAN